MNFLVLKLDRFFIYFDSIKSDNLGLFISFFLHSVMLIFAIGLPNFFNPKSIYIPNIIPIEIVNISDFTSMSKNNNDSKKTESKLKKIKEKKFNSSEVQEIKKIKIKNKPKIKEETINKDINTKDDLIIKEKKATPEKIESKKVIQNISNIESLPSKKIKPRLKPQNKTEPKNTKVKSDILIDNKPKPKAKPQPQPTFDIASMLKDLRNEKKIQSNENPQEEKEDEIINKESEESKLENVKLSISEIDLLRQQLTACWIAPAGAVIEKGMIVKISAKLRQNRRVFEDSVRIIDTNISKSNSFYGPITESAMRTLLNPECTPLKLPKDKFNLWKNLIITFDYSIMKGY